MADRKKSESHLETHVWFDGETWHIYSERHYDIARFERWFGKPSRRGRENACAHWESLPPGILRIAKRFRRPLAASQPPSATG